MAVSKRFKETKIRVYKAVIMLQAVHRQKRTTGGLLKMSGGIALAEMYIEEAKAFLNDEMDAHEKKINSGQNVQVSDTTGDDSSNEAGKQKQ
jgi:hypothetical protein